MERTNIIRYINRLLNGTTATGDPNPGGAPATQPNQYLGQLGAWMDLNFNEALARSDPASATPLRAGRYQYVQYKSDGVTYAQGQVLYWADETNYIVTNKAPSAVSARVAGIATAPVAVGNYWFMQTKGVAWGQYRGTVTDKTADNLVVVVLNTNTIDAVADGTATTDGIAKDIIGIAKTIPVDGSLLEFYLKGLIEIA